MTTVKTGFEKTDSIYGIIVKETKLNIDQQNQVILELLRYVGFKVSHLVYEPSTIHLRDDDGSSSDEIRVLNKNSNIKVFDDEEEHQKATSWLDEIWHLVGQPAKYVLELGEKLIALSKAIEESVQLEPIVLTEYGETLRECSARLPEHHIHDKDKLKSIVGTHDICSGYLDLKPVSEHSNAIVCRSCHLRVVIPKTITTYGEIREFFKDLQ